MCVFAVVKQFSENRDERLSINRNLLEKFEIWFLWDDRKIFFFLFSNFCFDNKRTFCLPTDSVLTMVYRSDNTLPVLQWKSFVNSIAITRWFLQFVIFTSISVFVILWNFDIFTMRSKRQWRKLFSITVWFSSYATWLWKMC